MKRRILCLLIPLTILLQACNLPNKEPVNGPATSVAQTLTQVAINGPAISPTPTSTFLATITFTPLFSPTPASTATPSFAYVTLSQGTNCRVGPGTAYDLVDTFGTGQTIAVLGQDPKGEYWYVRSPNNNSVFCWMWGFYATGGNLAAVPFFTPPPSPTPTPGFDVSYAGLDTCAGWWPKFTLKNTGPLAFKSMSISVKDTVTAVTLTDFGDGFKSLNGCLPSGTIISLDPAQSYTIGSPTFAADPTGHKMKATITLCTNITQGGQCVVENLDFKP